MYSTLYIIKDFMLFCIMYNCKLLLVNFHFYLEKIVEVWDNALKSNLHPLYVKQKRVMRLVCKTGYLEHTAELFKSLYVLPFYDLIKYKIAIFMYSLS